MGTYNIVDIPSIMDRLNKLNLNDIQLEEIIVLLNSIINLQFANKSDIGYTRSDIEKIRLELLSYIERIKTDNKVDTDTLRYDFEGGRKSIIKWGGLLVIFNLVATLVILECHPVIHNFISAFLSRI